LFGFVVQAFSLAGLTIPFGVLVGFSVSDLLFCGINLGRQIQFLLKQFGVQRLAAFLPFLLSRLRYAQFFRGNLFGGFVSAFARRRLGPPVEHQEQQDQRAHGAEQHGQEREGRNLQFMAATPHATFPGRAAEPFVSGPLVRAVNK
jgi:hypothetical protein